MDYLVCPDCGCEDFFHTTTASVKRVGSVHSRYGFDVADDEIQDIERDYDALTCEDCGGAYEPTELVSVEVYSAGDEGTHDPTDPTAAAIQPWE